MTDMGGTTQQATPTAASLSRQSNDATLPELSGTGSAADNQYQESDMNGETVAVPLLGAAEPGAGAVVCLDYPFVVQTSEWHRTEEMLRLLAVLQERDRLARAIHDTVERSLLGIMIRLEGARSRTRTADRSVAERGVLSRAQHSRYRRERPRTLSSSERSSASIG